MIIMTIMNLPHTNMREREVENSVENDERTYKNVVAARLDISGRRDRNQFVQHGIDVG